MTWNYETAVRYLADLTNYEQKTPSEYTAEVISLDRPMRLLGMVGMPQESFPIILVAGTKGKGSVCAMLHSILTAAGYRTGLFTSPHLQSLRERYRIGDRMIEETDFTELIHLMSEPAERIPGVTWFEITTALAYLYFARQSVDIAVIEVGLGGRLDATNVVSKTLVSVITSLGYDHQQLLGSSLSQIAREKAGIIKPGGPVVSSVQPAEAERVIEEVAKERASPLLLGGRDFAYHVNTSSADSLTFSVTMKGAATQQYSSRLVGAHQALNGSVAVATIEAVRGRGLQVSEDAVRDGLQRVNWPGRLEVLWRRSPLIVLDGAHNIESARFLSEALLSLFPNVPRVGVIGLSSDKDAAGFLSPLLNVFSALVLTKAHHLRAHEPSDLERMTRKLGYGNTIQNVPVVADALTAANELARESSPSGLVVVTGSLFVIGEARDALGLKPGEAEDPLSL